MFLFEKMRKLGFIALDSISQNSIMKQLKDIDELFSNETRREIVNKVRLESLLNHATNTTRYYSRYKGITDLNDFPIVNKKEMKNDYEGFLSNVYKEDNLVKVYTGGSYGTPFTFQLTKEKKARQLAEVIYFSRWAGYDIGIKHAYLRARLQKSNFKLRLQNQYYIYTRTINNDWFANARKIIKEKKVRVLIGFPTAISMLAQYCREIGDTPKDFSIIGVITSSEPLLSSQRDIIESTFGCSCLSRYSTEELGVLAHECPKSKKHHINTASYKVEILDLDKDEPVKEGEVGRIIVTDLFSYAMPLIRYETGDLGILGNECSCGLKGEIIQSLHGRSVQIVYNTNGDKVLPYFIEEVMKEHSNVMYYQFIQEEEKKYRFKVCKIEGTELEKEKIVNGIKTWIGKDAIIDIELVDDIPTLPSGKRPYVINNYNPKIN